MRLRRNHREFGKYFECKVAKSKEKRLLLNNIENNALKLICDVLKSGKPHIKNFRSANPGKE